MSDPQFFAPAAALTVKEIAALTGARLVSGDPERRISSIASLDHAGPDAATFFENRRYSDSLKETRAGACFCAERDVGLVPATAAVLETRRPYRAFALLGQRLFPGALRPQPAMSGSGVSPAAHVDPTATIEAGATVEAGAVVGAGAEIGGGALIGPAAVIGPGVRIGRGSVVGAGASVYNAFVGNRVVIHSGARLGQDGFGYVPGAEGHTKIVQIGRVIVQDDVEIGANTTIDRGALRDTVIGEGTKIDNLVQIAHNVVIGRHCLIAGQVGISGSVTIGDFVMMGGNAGIRDNVTIGHGARVAAAAAVHSNIPPGEMWAGYPAQPMQKWQREMRAMRRLLSRFLREPAAGSAPKGEDSTDGQ